MALREIIKKGDPVLEKHCHPVTRFDQKLWDLLDDMRETLAQANGLGLAAPQVGVLKRLVVIDCDQEDGAREPIVMLNPVIVAREGEPVAEDEGCLSIPGISVPVARPPFARCRYYDLDGQLWEIEGDGLLGRCLQHETDHLDGITMFERAEPMARLKALEDYERALAAGARPGETSVEA